MNGMLHTLWAYRGFIQGSVKRELQSKYRNSLLGGAWMVLNPLSMIIVYTVVFSQVMRARLPGVESNFAFSIYLCAGILTWGLFAEISGRAQNTFIENANLLKKLNFPRLCLPVIVVANALINFVIVFGLFTIFLIITGNFPGLPFLGLIPVILLLVLFGIGLGITLGILNVFFRDVGQFYGIALTFWFWLTPIVYPRSILPEFAQFWMDFNPMAAIVGAFQLVLTQGQWPNWINLWPILLLSCALCLLGLTLFRKHAGDMVDEL